jgi:antitoxin YefM
MESRRVPSSTVNTARKRLGKLVRAVNDDTVAVEIVGKRKAAVLISKERYATLQEAAFLLRSPELMESLRREMQRALLEVVQAQPDGDGAADNPPQRSRARTGGKSKTGKKRKKRR